MTMYKLPQKHADSKFSQVNHDARHTPSAKFWWDHVCDIRKTRKRSESLRRAPEMILSEPEEINEFLMRRLRR